MLAGQEREKQNASEQISLQHIMELREAFDAADKHKGGALSLSEFVDAFGGIIGKDMNKKQINQLFMKIDADSNGNVDWDEFMNYMLLENETLSSMKAEHFEYIKSDRDDPAPTKTKHWHNDMITSILILNPENEGNKLSDDNAKEEDLKGNQKSNKNLQYITSSKDGSVKIWNAKTMQWIKHIDTFPEEK